MPPIKPIKRKALIYYLKQFGFEGPYAGGNHQYMIKEKFKIWIPNPHKGDISKSLLKKILQQANISQDEWEDLK